MTNEATKIESGSQIRGLRRNLSMSQVELADLLGISQARISRWEKNRDEVPRKHSAALTDLLLNKNGRLDPVVERLIERDRSIAVISGDALKIIKESPLVLDAFRLEANSVEGSFHDDVFEGKFKNDLAYDLAEMYLAEYVRDIGLIAPENGVRGLRCRIKMFSVEMHGSEKIKLRKTVILGEMTGDKYLDDAFILMPDEINACP